MNFEFSENLCGFQATEGSDMSRIKYLGQPALYCQCTESNDQVGIYRNIDLPNQAQYHLKITGQANNDRTYIKVSGRDNNLSLMDEVIYFKKNEQQTISIKFYGRVTNIRLAVLMGGDSIVVPGNSFLIFQIRLIPIINNESTDSNSTNSRSDSSLRITRSFETVAQLELERQDPLRSNQTPMEIGEYAILKNATNLSSGDDLYILSTGGLKYVSRIGMGRPGMLFGEPVHVLPGRQVPIFKDSQVAQSRLEECQREGSMEGFHGPLTSEYHYDSSKINGDIYLYLDEGGYVRWLRYPPT